MNLNKITAQSTLKELDGLKFYGTMWRVQDFIKMLCFSLPYNPKEFTISVN